MEILIPFRIEDLLLKPEMAGRIKLSEDMQQTLASLVGFDNTARRLLRCSDKGILFTTTPRIDNIVHVSVADSPYQWVGSDKKTTEVMIMAHPANTGALLVKNDAIATANNSWPLLAKEVVSFTIDNLKNLNLTLASASEKAIIAYTR